MRLARPLPRGRRSVGRRGGARQKRNKGRKDTFLAEGRPGQGHMNETQRARSDVQHEWRSRSTNSTRTCQCTSAMGHQRSVRTRTLKRGENDSVTGWISHAATARIEHLIAKPIKHKVATHSRKQTRGHEASWKCALEGREGRKELKWRCECATARRPLQPRRHTNIQGASNPEKAGRAYSHGTAV